MQCTFAVYGPGKGNSEVVSAFTTDCINVDGWSSNGKKYPLIQSFIDQNKKGWFGGSMLDYLGKTKNVFDSLDNWEYPTLLPLSSKLIISNFGTSSARLIGTGTQSLSSRDIQTFGEYKLSLEQIDYQTCVSSTDGKNNSTYKLSTKKDGYKRVCEVDFAVTDHYLVQKSPYGEVSASTPLKKYQTKRGEPLFNTDKNVNASNYKVPASLGKTYDRFVAKYSKLAKKVKGKSDLSKVPGKSIYFVDGDQKIDLQAMGIATDKPFTLIAKKGADILIKGSLYSNAMIMTKGKIIFDAKGSCNGDLTKYGHAGQMVKGIFYAGKGFGSSNHENLKNTAEKLSKSERCNYGNLHIKGVAIGDLSKVVSARRSELYTWFK